jgi:hypothetical protein
MLLAAMEIVPMVSAEKSSVSEEEKKLVRTDNPSDI